jgi:hypothetical protein
MGCQEFRGDQHIVHRLSSHDDAAEGHPAGHQELCLHLHQVARTAGPNPTTSKITTTTTALQYVGSSVFSE